jgi:hypothetical protein
MVDHDWGARRDECNLPGSAESKRRARQRSRGGTSRMMREYRQCRWSTCTERENLAGDAKGKDAMGRRRESLHSSALI